MNKQQLTPVSLITLVPVMTTTYKLLLFSPLAFLGACLKFQKAIISFCHVCITVCLYVRLSVHPSVNTQGKTRIPLEGFSSNLIDEDFWKNLSIKFKIHQNATRITGTLHEELCTFITISS
jgi:hypothetical protein